LRPLCAVAPHKRCMLRHFESCAVGLGQHSTGSLVQLDSRESWHVQQACVYTNVVYVQLTWRIAPVLAKKDIKKLDEFRQYVTAIEQQEDGEEGGASCPPAGMRMGYWRWHPNSMQPRGQVRACHCVLHARAHLRARTWQCARAAGAHDST
jgi:hypothetical protein